jgi:hypothetical protein
MIKVWQYTLLSILVAGSVTLAGCSSHSERIDHYVSPQVQGESAKINLEEVQKAFWDSKGKDFNSWMGAFEKRVNEIYDGKEVVSIDATRKDGKLIVTGYIDTQKKEGFQPGDEKLFTIEQTGEATEDKQIPYRVSDNNDRPYYEGHHSFLDNPFLQMMILSHFMGGGMGSPWGGHYYTPYQNINIIHSYRDTYRATPGYSTQQASNQGFFSRFKTSSNGSLQSKNTFGKDFSSSVSSTPKRSWLGSGGSGLGSSSSSSNGGIFGSTGSSESVSSWGGRRSGGSGLFSSGRSSRSWGGRRR